MPPASMALGTVVRATFGRGGVLERSIPGYEPRPGQHRMAAAVAEVLDQGGRLLAEAGTGTGKTLAYLVPAVLSGGRVLVSTGTKNLQEQILFKDVPALRAALGRPFTATLMKGRANYLCLHRWEQYRDGVLGGTSAHGRLIESGDRVLLPVLQSWARETETGDRAELRELPENLPLWKEVAADAETCLGAECPRHDDCFVTRMRQRAAESDVVIVNHHLLCADAAVREGEYGEVIPDCPTLVVDEAHQLEEVATNYFGYAFSALRVDDLVHDIRRALAAGTHESHADATFETGEIGSAAAVAAERAREFFTGIDAAFGRTLTSESRIRYTADQIADHRDAGCALGSALDDLGQALRPGRTPRQDPPEAEAGAGSGADRREAFESLARRAALLADDLDHLLRADDRDFVYFVERRPRTVVLRAAPVEVSHIIRDKVLGRFRAVVLTSATLAVDGSFAYAKRRLGIEAPSEIRVPSEFDYASQALLYLPPRMPPPKAPGFAEAAAREAAAIVTRSRGRAFVLFTSYAVLRVVQRVLEMSLHYPILVQGTAPRSLLIERFKSTPHAVLLGTSSFWQGVDVVGDALSCVVIDKLPFASPADPVTAARIDAVREAGGDPFGEYQVPLAILTLQQGLGRLIRHRADRGVLAILDPRLRTMPYGRRFLAALPPAPVTHDLRDVEAFFAGE